ncbi:MAG: hypothetical protein WCH04_00135 [Gammaproteobacteria bacterium]
MSKPDGLIKQASPLHREIMSDAGSVLIAEIDERMAAPGENLRELVEQAAAEHEKDLVLLPASR